MRTMRNRAFLASLVAMAIATRAPFAVAADPEAPRAAANDTEIRANQHKAAGDAALDERRYDDAVAAYSASYALVQDPVLLYNRGRAYIELHRNPEALADLEAFQRSAPAAVRARVPDLPGLVAAVRARVARLVITCNVAGARVAIRDRAVGVTPLGEIGLELGPAKIEIQAEGFVPFQKTVVLGSGVSHVDATLVSRTGTLVIRAPAGAVVAIDGESVGSAPVERIVSAGPHAVVVRAGDEAESRTIDVGVAERKEVEIIQAPPRDAHPARRNVAYALGGVGIAGLGVAAAFGIATVLQDDQREAEVRAWHLAEADSWRDRALTSQRIAIASAIGGGIALGTGVVLLLTGGDGGKRPAAGLRVTPFGGALVGAF
jgi:tetratricopeptide (TPR) repeat protein